MWSNLQLESLRAALANRGPKSPLRNKPKEAVPTPQEKPKLLVEKTPPRTRRLSIENCSALKAEKKNVEERNGPKTPFTQAKSRRLSLEGPRYRNKTPEQIKLSDPVRTPNGGSKVELNQPRPPRSPVGRTDIRTKELALQLQDGEPVKTTNVGGFLRDLNRPRAPPRSPTRNNALKNLCIENTDTRTKIPRLQQLKTPEPVVKFRKIGQKGMKSEEHDDGGTQAEFRTPGLTNSSGTQGKGGSHIRKSLRSIGKLINGSEKR